jgi:hypothetical protein
VAASGNQDFNVAITCLVNGVQRSRRPLPTQRTWAPVPRCNRDEVRSVPTSANPFDGQEQQRDPGGPARSVYPAPPRAPRFPAGRGTPPKASPIVCPELPGPAGSARREPFFRPRSGRTNGSPSAGGWWLRALMRRGLQLIEKGHEGAANVWPG